MKRKLIILLSLMIIMYGCAQQEDETLVESTILKPEVSEIAVEEGSEQLSSAEVKEDILEPNELSQTLENAIKEMKMEVEEVKGSEEIPLVSLPKVITSKSFSIYTDGTSPDNHYIPSGWMGDYSDLTLDDKYMDSSHSGSTCIKISYTARRTLGEGWTGIYWQNPANNWGAKKGGFDLTGMNKLTVWMKGQKGGEILDKIVVGGIKGVYPDSSETAFGPIQLTDEWQEYTINLSGKDLPEVAQALGGYPLRAGREVENLDGYVPVVAGLLQGLGDGHEIHLAESRALQVGIVRMEMLQVRRALADDLRDRLCLAAHGLDIEHQAEGRTADLFDETPPLFGRRDEVRLRSGQGLDAESDAPLARVPRQRAEQLNRALPGGSVALPLQHVALFG